MSSWRRRAAVRIELWTRFWDQREAPTSLWLCRVLVSLVVAADLLQAWSLDLVPAVWAAPPDGLGWGVTGDAPPWSVSWFGPSSEVVVGVWGLALLTSVTFGIGFATRVSGFLLALLLAELARCAPNGDRGVDVLLRVAIPILALSGSHARWSVDAGIRRWRGRAPVQQVTAWPRYLLFAQLVWMYNSAAQNRYDSAWWPTGHFSALGTLLCDPHFARFDSGWVAALYPLTQVATASTMSFEGGSPLLLLWTWLDRAPKRGGGLGQWVRRFKVRWLWLAFGVALHLGIALTMRLGIFSFGVLALYPAFVHPSELRAAAAWLGRRRHEARPSAD
ncbi:MAG: hypothetical protein EOO73_29540 [Myxococcales bacterium]|nr:MAG: hypothetical protein EOO73_29540 [Myxococcales bacterium]